MRVRAILLSVAVLFSVPVTRTIDAQVPQTAPGRQLAAWLDALNTGDRATAQRFMDKSMPGRPVDGMLNTFTRSGGYDVKKVEESTDTHVVALLQERGPAKQFARITVTVAASAPDRIEGIRLQPVEPPADLAPRKLTASEADAARSGAPFRQYMAWLDAFNTGDHDRIRRFVEASWPSGNADAQNNFRDRTGGFEFRALEQATSVVAVGLMQERSSDQFARFTVVVDSAEPHQIVRFEISAIPRPAEFPVARESEAELVANLRSKLEKDVAADRFSGTVLVAHIDHGAPKVVFSGAYGLADRDRHVANALDTRFRIGSMNKMFTATSILQLAQAGKIKLTDPLGKYVPDYPNQDIARKVTIHQLLTHTGGTGDIFGPDFAHRLELRTLDDYVKLYGKRAPLFEPGSQWVYSNYGMVLLGVVIERVSGQSYYDYVAQHVFRPAGMTRSGSEPESEAVGGRSVGYMRGQGGGSSGWTPNTETLPYRGTSAGGGYSTVEDLLKFANALMDHKLLDAEHTALLISGKVDAGGGRMYAYGFEDDRKDGVGDVGHGGGAPGMNGELRIYPKSGYVVAVLSNLDPPAATQVWSYIDLRLPK